MPCGAVTMGGCDWNPAGLPTISLNAHRDAVHDFEQALITILHETFHAQQCILVRQLMAGELAPDDPRHAQVLMFAANAPGSGYLPPDVSQDDYEVQPVEIDAEQQGAAAATAVRLAIRARRKAPRS